MKEIFSSERRMNERLPIESLVTISDGQRFYVESLTDISMGGVGVETLQEFLSGSRVTMFFPSSSRVKIGGMVRWARKKGRMHRMGLQFTDMTPEQENSIYELIH
ncbi:MAG: PilZ domain-containing protein [Deltaproteobacteria bacterium]|nr:PilZ domain-containing protein [Deltaproteobacteria bacterium]MDL1961691.1 PilZ domain-containing protein [Deltaproteobacteria bacterium]